MPIWLDDVQCTGEEGSIFDCNAVEDVNTWFRDKTIVLPVDYPSRTNYQFHCYNNRIVIGP